MNGCDAITQLRNEHTRQLCIISFDVDYVGVAQQLVAMLYLVGLGLGDVKDITVKGLEVVKRADRVYLEAYTSLLTVNNKDELVSCVFAMVKCNKFALLF